MLGNSTSFQILFPAPYSIEVSRLRQQLEEAHFAWKTEWKRQQLDFVIENIRFVHDPTLEQAVLQPAIGARRRKLVLAGDTFARHLRGIIDLNDV